MFIVISFLGDGRFDFGDIETLGRDVLVIVVGVDVVTSISPEDGMYGMLVWRSLVFAV